MKKSFYLAAAAALLMATTSAHAGSGFSFEIGGQKIHIDAPRNCSSLDCLSVSNNGSPINLKNMNLKGKKSDDDNCRHQFAAPGAARSGSGREQSAAGSARAAACAGREQRPARAGRRLFA